MAGGGEGREGGAGVAGVITTSCGWPFIRSLTANRVIISRNKKNI